MAITSTSAIRRLGAAPTVFVFLLGSLCAACAADDGGTPSAGSGGTGSAGSGTAGVAAEGRIAGSGGTGAGATVSTGRGPLTVNVTVDGAATVCGSCSILLARAEGGNPPYVYTWSDTTLAGSGPHTVCPTEPTVYSVTATDTDALLDGARTHTTQTASATGSVECVAQPDAGVDPYLTGCFDPTIAERANKVPACPLPDAGGSLLAESKFFMLPKPLAAGRSYTVSFHTQRLTLGIAPILVDIFGVNEMCGEKGQKFGTLQLDSFTVDQTFCVVPDRDYTGFVTVVHVDGVFFDNTTIASGAVCAEACVPP